MNGDLNDNMYMHDVFQEFISVLCYQCYVLCFRASFESVLNNGIEI